MKCRKCNEEFQGVINGENTCPYCFTNNPPAPKQTWGKKKKLKGEGEGE